MKILDPFNSPKLLWLFSAFLSCSSARQITPTQVPTQENPCREIFQIDDSEAFENFIYEKNRLVEIQRFAEGGELLYSTKILYVDGKVIEKSRRKNEKHIFTTRFAWKNGQLLKTTTDDTNEKGELVPDGKPDLMKTYFYGDKGRLQKIEIERAEMPHLITNVDYDSEGHEKHRITRRENVIVETLTHTYENGKRQMTSIDQNGDGLPEIEYRFSYDKLGRLKETRIHTREYDAKKQTFYECSQKAS